MSIVLLGATVLGIGFLYFLFPLAVNQFMRRSFSEKAKKSGSICLSFDDGPHPEATPAILDLLKAKNSKATFFLVGENVERYPALTARIIADGHEIGEHSYSHTHPWRTSPLRSLDDLRKGARTLAPYEMVHHFSLFRPPFGKFNLVTLLYVWLSKKHVAFWTVDPKDYQQDSGEAVFNLLLPHLHPGSVILLHDGRRNTHNDVRTTVSALRLILDAVDEKGLALTTIGEVIFHKRMKREDFTAQA
jgi:peptidoglycan/xylan/chitin deacetylase (PgdA/CDA1 family)